MLILYHETFNETFCPEKIGHMNLLPLHPQPNINKYILCCCGATSLASSKSGVNPRLTLSHQIPWPNGPSSKIKLVVGHTTHFNLNRQPKGLKTK